MQTGSEEKGRSEEIGFVFDLNEKKCCELLNTPLTYSSVYLTELQTVCHISTRKTRHWADESTISVVSSKLKKMERERERGWTKLISKSRLKSRILLKKHIATVRGAKPTMTGSTLLPTRYSSTKFS
jgi:hypothetical protein